MTSLATDASAGSGRGARGRGGLLAAAALVLVLGLALGRFVLYEPAAQQAPAVTGSLDAALADLEAAVASRPDDLTAWQALGVAYTRQAGQVGDAAFYGLAARAFDEADERSPEHPETLVGRGNLALALHRFGDARELGERATAALPDDAAALGLLVDAEVELGGYEAAAQHLQRMLDVRPDLTALARTSYLRELHGDLQGAVEAMRQAEAAASGASVDAATVTALLGDLRLKQGDLDAAEAAYQRAERMASGFGPAAIGRARVLAARGDRPAAISQLERVVDRYPQPGAAILYGELQALDGRAEAAADTFDLVRALTALQEQSGQVTDLEMALFEADHGEPARAVELAQRAYDARPQNIFAADALGWALFRAGRVHEALPYAEQAVRLDTADGPLRYHAAEVFAATGDTRRARSELDVALNLRPWLSVASTAQADALDLRLR